MGGKEIRTRRETRPSFRGDTCLFRGIERSFSMTNYDPLLKERTLDLSGRRMILENESLARISSSSYRFRGDREQFRRLLHLEAKSNLTSNRWIHTIFRHGCPTSTHEGLNIRPARTNQLLNTFPSHSLSLDTLKFDKINFLARRRRDTRSRKILGISLHRRRREIFEEN